MTQSLRQQMADPVADLRYQTEAGLRQEMGCVAGVEAKSLH